MMQSVKSARLVGATLSSRTTVLAMKSRNAVLISSLASFLEQILLRQGHQAILLICSSREDFLKHVLDDGTRSHQQTNLLLSEISCSKAPDEILLPTLHLLAQARNISLVYTPSVNHLRAALEDIAYYKTHLSPRASTGKFPAATALAIVDSLAVHKLSGEFSAQGLSRTYALATEAAFKASLDLQLVDLDRHTEQGSTPMSSYGNEAQGSAWNQAIPLLTSNTRAMGHQGWAEKSVPYCRIVQTWFKLSSSHEI